MQGIGRVFRRCARFREERAQAALEFMLAFPFFIAFFLLVVDFGLLSFGYISAANGVREGARFGAVNCGDGACTVEEVRTRTLERTPFGIALAEVTVGWADINGDGENRGRGDSVVVKVNHPYDFLFFPVTIPIMTCADMRLERMDGTSGLPSDAGCAGGP